MSFIEGNRWCDRFKCVCVGVCACTHVSDFSKYLHGKNLFYHNIGFHSLLYLDYSVFVLV